MWKTVDGRPLQVDEGRHAACQATCEGVEGAEWEKLYYGGKIVQELNTFSTEGELRSDVRSCPALQSRNFAALTVVFNARKTSGIPSTSRSVRTSAEGHKKDQNTEVATKRTASSLQKKMYF